MDRRLIVGLLLCGVMDNGGLKAASFLAEAHLLRGFQKAALIKETNEETSEETNNRDQWANTAGGNFAGILHFGIAAFGREPKLDLRSHADSVEHR